MANKINRMVIFVCALQKQDQIPVSMVLRSFHGKEWGWMGNPGGSRSMPLQTVSNEIIIYLSGSGRAERKDMLNTTRHVIWHSHFHSLIVARSSKTLIKTRHQDAGMEEWDRVAGQLDPITTGNNC